MNLNVLSIAAAQDKHKLASGASWLLLADFNYQGQHMRVARNTDPVTFDGGDGLGPQVYQAFNFDLQNMQQKNDGSLPAIELKASNVGRMLEGALVQYSGAAGCTCTLYVVNTDNATGEADLAVATTIVRTTTDSSSVTFTLSAPSPLRTLFPRRLYFQGTCMWRYKSTRCGYTGTLPTCSLTFDGVNGCIDHANQQRFGGFPGIATNGASVASQV